MENPVLHDLDILAQKHIEKDSPKLEALCREHIIFRQANRCPTGNVLKNLRTDRYSPEFETVYASLMQSKLRQVKAACGECQDATGHNSLSPCDMSKPECLLKQLTVGEEAWNYINRILFTTSSGEIVTNADLASDFISFERKSPTESVCIISGAKSEFETNESVSAAFRDCRHEILLLPHNKTSPTFAEERVGPQNEIDLGCGFEECETINVEFCQLINTLSPKSDSGSFRDCVNLHRNQCIHLLKESRSKLSSLFWPPREWFFGNAEAKVSFNVSNSLGQERTVRVHLPEFRDFKAHIPPFLALDLSLTLGDGGKLKVTIVATDLKHHEVEIEARELLIQ
jgi:hypothetical protein